MDSYVRNVAHRVGHLASRPVGGQSMVGPKSRSWAPDHGSVIQDYSGPGVSGGGGAIRNVGNVVKGVTGVAGDVASGAMHMSEMAINPIAGAKGLVGDVMSGAKHGLQAVKGVLPFLPIN
jgi:hypothetical protein